MEEIAKEIDELNKELATLKEIHNDYMNNVDVVKSKQKKCAEGLKHQTYRMKQLTGDLLKLKSTDNLDKIEKLQENLKSRKIYLREIGETLPRKNGVYLNVVIGHVNVSLLSKDDKFAYKEDYEKFKLSVTTVSFIYNFFLYFFIRNRILDAAFHFLLVWYYCTLTIREQILVINGSRIKGWWLASHFIYTTLSGIMLIWPISDSYDRFRDQFMLYSLYMGFVQFIQYYYQKGSLYKMRALGERHKMDITVDGFMSWMFKHLTFILPLLFFVYFYQLYNAWTLYQINYDTSSKEWHVLVVAFIFFFLATGNILTALTVIRQKIHSRTSRRIEYLIHKYHSLRQKDN